MNNHKKPDCRNDWEKREDRKATPSHTPRPIDVRIEVNKVLGRQVVSFIRISDGRLELTGFDNIADALEWNKENDNANTYGLKYRIVYNAAISKATGE